jgi:MFS family permease
MKFLLAENTSLTNVSAYLVAAALNVALFVFINATQSFVLSLILTPPASLSPLSPLSPLSSLSSSAPSPSPPLNNHAPPSSPPLLGSYSASLTTIDQLVSLLAVSLWGILSDIVGRRVIYASGFALMSVSLSLYTFSPYFSLLILLRVIFALGGSAASSMLTAVLADYATDNDRGKLASLVGLCAGLGALISLSLFLRIPSYFKDAATGLHVAYGSVAILSLLFSITLLFALVGKNRSDQIDQEDPLRHSSTSSMPSLEEVNQDGTPVSSHSPEQLSNETTSLIPHQSSTEPNLNATFLSIAKKGFKAALQDPRVLLGYTASFLA